MTRRTCHEDVFAVVRVDYDYPDAPNTSPDEDGLSIRFGVYEVTIKEIVRTVEAARAEVARLSALNTEKGCRYYWQGTRYFPDGGSFGSTPKVDKKRTGSA